MKKASYLIILSGAVLFAAGCGSSSAQKASTSPSPPPAGNQALNVNVSHTVNAKVVGANSPMTPGAQNAGSSNANSRPVRPGRRERIDVNPSATPLPPTFEKAPENSEIAISMERDGSVVETRLFKEHPQLQRVEMRWTDPKSRLIKATLRNGKVVEIRSDRVTNLRTIAVADLLSVLGIRAAQPGPVRPRTQPRR